MKTPRSIANTPQAKDSFVQRLCKALDTTPYKLSEILGVPYADMHNACMAGKKPDIMDATIWWEIAEHLDNRLALMMAARHELQVALQRSRASRAVRVATALTRDRKGSPRGKYNAD